MEQNKPLKIVRKIASAPPVPKAEPQPVTVQVGKGLSDKAKKTIELIAASGGTKPVSAAMREAGYAESTAHNPQALTASPAFKAEIDKYLTDLVAHRRKILDLMDLQLSTASYANLTMALDVFTKQIQLLSGRATGRITFELPDEKKREIENIISLNTSEYTIIDQMPK